LSLEYVFSEKQGWNAPPQCPSMLLDAPAAGCRKSSEDFSERD
jgi:hypothetical protein